MKSRVRIPSIVFVLLVAATAFADRVQYRLDISLASGTSWGCKPIKVPAGKRLIINQISASVALPQTDRAVIFVTSWYDTQTGYTGVQHHFPLEAAGVGISTGPGNLSYSMNAQPEIWSDRDVNVCLSRGPSLSTFPGLAGAIVGVSGRLVTLPE